MASSGGGSTCRPRRWPPHPAAALVAATTTAAREGIWSTVLRHRTTAGCTVSSKPVPSAPVPALPLRLSLSLCVCFSTFPSHHTDWSCTLPRTKERKNSLSLSVFISSLSLLKLLTRLEEQTRNCNRNWIYFALIYSLIHYQLVVSSF